MTFVDGPEFGVLASNTHFLFGARMTFYLFKLKPKVAILARRVLKRSKAYSSVWEVQLFVWTSVKRIEDCYGQVKAILLTHYMATVVVVLQNRLNNVHALFTLQHTQLVACVGDQNEKEHEAVACAHLRR